MRRAALAAVLVAAACTGEKAAALRVGVSQADIASQAAYAATEAMIRAQAAPPEMTETEALEEFVRIVSSVPADERVTSEVLADALDPFRAPAAPVEVETFLAGSRRLSRELAAAVEGLDGRSAPFARDAVRRLVPVARRVAARHAVVAEFVAAHPPTFVEKRAKALRAVNVAREAGDRRALAEARDAALAVVAGEEATAREVAAAHLRAAAFWRGAADAGDGFGNLSVEEIAGKVQGFLAGADVSGDLAKMRSRASEFVGELRADPAVAGVVEAAVTEINRRTES